MDIVIVTKKGLVIKFDCADVRKTSRGSKGVRAIKLEADDEVVSAVGVPDPTTTGFKR